MLGPSKKALLRRIEALEGRMDAAETAVAGHNGRIGQAERLLGAFRGAVRNLASGFGNHRGWIEDIQDAFTIHPRLRSKLGSLRHQRELRDAARAALPPAEVPPAEGSAEGNGEHSVHEAAS